MTTQDTMIVELKNVKHSESNSRETNCFQATIYIDGKRAGTVSNDGNGGPDLFHFADAATLARFNAYCESLPPVEGVDGEPMPCTSEIYIESLFEAHLEKSLLSRHAKKATMYTLKGDAKGQWRRLDLPYSKRVKDFLVGKYGETLDAIANETLFGQVAK